MPIVAVVGARGSGKSSLSEKVFTSDFVWDTFPLCQDSHWLESQELQLKVLVDSDSFDNSSEVAISFT